MDRDKGLRRTTAITGALVAASIAGTLAVGLAAHASESTANVDTGTATTDDSGSAATTTTTTTTTEDSPSLQSGSDDSGQVTSGGS